MASKRLNSEHLNRRGVPMGEAAEQALTKRLIKECRKAKTAKQLRKDVINVLLREARGKRNSRLRGKISRILTQELYCSLTWTPSKIKGADKHLEILWKRWNKISPGFTDFRMSWDCRDDR